MCATIEHEHTQKISVHEIFAVHRVVVPANAAGSLRQDCIDRAPVLPEISRSGI